jgi:hypothetical protein
LLSLPGNKNKFDFCDSSGEVYTIPGYPLKPRKLINLIHEKRTKNQNPFSLGPKALEPCEKRNGKMLE